MKQGKGGRGYCMGDPVYEHKKGGLVHQEGLWKKVTLGSC